MFVRADQGIESGRVDQTLLDEQRLKRARVGRVSEPIS